jgi:hypothetical protein
MAMSVKGYRTWKHENTIQKIFLANIVFFDGTNKLTCHSFGIGPFWVATSFSETLVGCLTGDGNTTSMCPEGYFGVDP